MLNSLVQTALKLLSPGVPDIYQGTELWDLSLVDPDNRRPVSFAERAALLDEIAAVAALPSERLPTAVDRLREAWPDGRIKLYLLRRLLALRREMPQLFAGGDYRPLAVEGGQAERVCAFQRARNGRRVIVVVGRHFAALTAPAATLPAPAAWQDTSVAVAENGSAALRDILTGRFTGEKAAIPISELFVNLPVAVLV